MLFISQLFSDPMGYLMWILLVVFSVCIHEYFHALTALSQGDSTAAEKGYLTLNPLVQIGVFPLILLLFIGITWGGTPINPSRMRHKYSHALVSFSGPLSNAMLFLMFCILIAVLSKKNMMSEGALVLLGTGAVLNFVLFLFNMLPVPPLDGFSILSYFFPPIERSNSEIKSAAFFIIFIIAFFSFGKLYYVGALFAETVINTISGLLNG